MGWAACSILKRAVEKAGFVILFCQKKKSAFKYRECLKAADYFHNELTRRITFTS
jgi:hypothetical protein